MGQETISAPTIKGLIGRTVVMVLTGMTIAAGSLFAFYRLVAQVTVADQKVISSYGVPISAAGAFMFLGVIVAFGRPLWDYVRRAQRGEVMSEAESIRAQDRALNLGFQIAGIALAFYAVVDPLIFYFAVRALGWPKEEVGYGVVAGVICGLFMVPLGSSFGNWIMRPLLVYTAAQLRNLPARQAGMKVPLRAKMVTVFLPIMLAFLLYGSAIGYAQTAALYKNLEQMEAMLPPEARAQLIERVVHREDPGVRSSRFYHLDTLRFSLILFVSAAVGITLFFTLFASAEMTRPLSVLRRAARRIEAGRLEENVHLVTNDELGDLAQLFNRMKDTIVIQMGEMSAMLGQLREGMAQMEPAIATMLAVSSEQTAGAVEQATAVAETATVTDNILANTRAVGERAARVGESSRAALTACREGDQVLGRASAGFAEISFQAAAQVEAATELEQTFKKTFGIVELIEEIADQVELLAFNAALEAAGAGDAGQRFAVVAEETGTLARRSSEATRVVRTLVGSIREAMEQITQLTRTGAQKVGEGGQAIEAVAGALNTISHLSTSTSSLVQEITRAGQEQTLAVEELSRSMGEVNDVARKVESSAKELESAVSGLSEFAEALRRTLAEKF